ncbi:MAG TPA: M56 family metallopeptidase [Pseudolysinimonas sp.]|nr:M56 family metallopeptidase [Pseudolysinimonas sp.]
MTTIIDAAGWTLVHFLWQGAAIAAAAAIGLRLLRRGSPQARYVLACVALAAMLASPAVTAARLLSPTPPAVAPVQRTLFLRVLPQGTHESEMLRFVGFRQRSVAAGTTAAGSGDAAPRGGTLVMPALVVAWLAGVCLLFARLAAGLWRVRALRRAGRALPPSPWQAACDRLGHRLGLRRAVRVADVSFVDGPVVIGWLRPVVLLPIAAVAGLTPSQVEAILAHELAHVRRHDAVVNACQTVTETLLFYHPAVWWLSSRVRAEREHCCDDIALEMSGDPLAYAEALAELESWRVGSVPLAMAATGGPLLSRVARVLGPPRPARIGAATTAALVLAFVVAAGALQYLVARQPAAVPDAAPAPSTRAWRMLFDHPSGQMVIRGFTARDLVRYAYQLPLSRIVGGPAWLDTDAFELATTLDHVPAADETPALVRSLLEERFGLAVHESTIKVPVLALEIARPDGALGPNLQPATGECFDQRAWVVAGAPRLLHGQGERTRFCGVWDSRIDYQRAESVSMDDLATSMRQRFAPAIGLDVVNRTGLPGVFDVSLEVFQPAAALMAVTPSLRLPLQAAGFQSLPEAIEEQLGLKLVPATANAPAIVIDRIEMPTP